MPGKSLLSTAEKIFEALPVQSSASVNEISRKSGVAWSTAKSWLELIEFIQNQPDLIVVKTSTGFEYKRGTMAGRPKK